MTNNVTWDKRLTLTWLHPTRNVTIAKGETSRALSGKDTGRLSGEFHLQNFTLMLIIYIYTNEHFPHFTGLPVAGQIHIKAFILNIAYFIYYFEPHLVLLYLLALS